METIGGIMIKRRIIVGILAVCMIIPLVAAAAL